MLVFNTNFTLFIYASPCILFLYFFRRWFNGPWFTKKSDLSWKTVIVTGSSAGIGKEAALDLLENGANVIFACRDEKKTRAVISAIKNPESRARATFIKLDLGSVDSIIKFNNEYRRTFNEDLDILINNAGAVQDYFSLTEGIESSIMVNHIGHKLLTLLLLDKFNSEEARIINIASVAHTFSNYSVEDLKRLENNLSFDGEGDNWGIKKAFTQYGNSKLANIYFTQYLAEKLGSHIKSVAIHPGSVNSEFNRWLDNFHWIFKPFIWLLVNPVFWFISKSTSAGTQTTYVGIYEDFEKLENGSYLEDCKKGKLSNTAKDSKIRDEFMKYSWMLLDKVVNNKVKITKL